MTDIKELALRVAGDIGVWNPGDKNTLVDPVEFATRFLAEWSKTQEPVGGFRYNTFGGWQQVSKEYEDEPDVTKLYTHPAPVPEPADLIERLAARIPEGYVVVPREPTEAMCQAASARCHHPQALYKTAYNAMIAVGEMKP